MKHFLAFAMILSVCMLTCKAQTTKTVGGTGADYSTLKLAFDAINAGTITGAISLQITSNTSETASAVLNASGNGSASFSSVTIFPTGTGFSITGNFDASLISLNGADNVTIDGRANQTGSGKDLTITNTGTGSFSSAIRFINSAENNVVKYCNINGSCFSAGVGVVNFTSSASGNGNDNNIIEYSNISNAGSRPVNMIFSSGGTGRENNGNIVRNNNIFDFFNAGISSYGINISHNSTDWTISGNSFYETSVFAPTGSYNYYVIRANTGNNHNISNNYIGGSEPVCAGSAWTTISSFAHYFCGFFINGGTSCTLQNNTITNINYTSTEDNPWDGIFINSGNVSVTGNTIGATTGTGSITITTPLPSATTTITGGVVTEINLVGGGSGYTTAPIITFSTSGSTTPATATANLSGGVVTSITLNTGGAGYTGAPNVVFDGQSTGYSTSHGIIGASAGIVDISNNNIGSITTIGSSTYSHGFESMYMRNAAGTITINNNLVGSLTTANSIHTSSSAASSLQKQDVYGIYSASVGTVTISGNTVANLHNAYTGTNSSSRTRGISVIAGSNTIQNNTVRNISSASRQTSFSSSASVIGISQTSATSGTTQTLSGNTIYDLLSTNPTSARVDLYGIYYSGPSTGAHEVSGNFVHSLSVLSTNIGSDIDGIVINSGAVVTCANNIINLGEGITLGYLINGIWDGTVAGNTVNFYFNTVYIGGTVTSGVTSSTGALWNKYNSSTRNYRNNVLYNARTGGTTGKHYAIRIEGVANTTIDYNDYFSASGTLGRIATLDKADLAAWKLGTSQDANSLSINPGFTIPGGTSYVNYYTSAVLPGVSGTGITTDYAGLSRRATPQMGALEANNYIWQGSINTDFGTAGNWENGAVPPDGANILFSTNPDRSCVLDQNRTVGGITNAQNTDKLVVNGKQLTITGVLTFSNNAQIDATAALSVIVFAGSTAQNLPSDAFVSNSVEAMTINKSNSLTLNGDLTVQGPLTLTSGDLIIGAHTLTLNGAIITTAGTLTGGSSTNINISGTGANTSLPAVSLNNLSINRPNGISLGGSVSIGGTLSLTNGTLTLGANVLTISGNSPIRTNGNIDGSNSASAIVFSNSTAITLPASIFYSSVNDLTISGAEGLTVNSDFTINGVLNLQGANPSTTKGRLDLGANTLFMGPNSTTTGIGDVTGIITRTTILQGVTYTFGNQFISAYFPNIGTLPSQMSAKISIGAEPSWRSGAIMREIDVIQTGGSGTKAIFTFHYLDSELNGNDEEKLVFWVKWNNYEYGRSSYNTTDNWVSLTNIDLAYFSSTWDDETKVKDITLDEYSTTNTLTWNGSVSSSWTSIENWTPNVGPASNKNIIIPDATTTLNDPDLPSATEIKSLTIEAGGILNSVDAAQLTINGGGGAWSNVGGTFNPNTSKIIFTGTDATISGTTNFYDVATSVGKVLWLTSECIMRIGGTMTNNGTWRTVFGGPTTVEYNGGDQTVVVPYSVTSRYSKLILSGTGIKTMPSSALEIVDDFITAGAVSVTAGASINIRGNLIIGDGTTFNTGNFDHSIGGDFENNGIFSASAGHTTMMNGTSAQSVIGTATTNFYNLTIDNSHGVNLLVNENVNNILTLTNGNLTVGSATLGINGTISKASGNIYVSPVSSLSFGGSVAFTIPNDLFSTTPVLNNLTINRSGGVALGNQNLTINGLLDLQSGSLVLGADTLTIAGSSPTRTSGNIDAGNTLAVLVFTNPSPVILPSSIFSGDVSNLTINSLGGITVTSDFTITGELNLQSENPSAFKGSLDMLDGSVIKTLTMGPDATTIGVGDVTGIVKRTYFSAGTAYSFGNQFTTITFSEEGTFPAELKSKISLGTPPSWKTAAINRVYDFVQTGGSNCIAAIATHYLDSELNGNNENELVQWTNGTPGPPLGLYEWGKSGFNFAENWIEISNVNIGYFPTVFGQLENTLSASEIASYTWNGSQSTAWSTIENWTPIGSPSSTSHVIIPDASTTPNSPALSTSTEIENLTIEAAGVLNSLASVQLTLNGSNGAWSNPGGTFNPGVGSVRFTNPNATIDGATVFYDLAVMTGSGLTMTANSATKIAGTLTNSGTLNAAIFNNTIEYNGSSQAILNPNGSPPGYHNLILSGSGTKTMPATSLSIYGNMTNNAEFSANGGTLVFNGSTAQELSGTTVPVFNHLSVTNSAGLSMKINSNVNGDLSITDGYLILDPGVNLTVSGTTNLNTGQRITLKSDIAGTASFIDAGITGGGSGTVERYLKNLGTESEWHLISSPIQSGQSGIFMAEYLMQYTEPLHTYQYIVPIDSVLHPMKGYAVWVINTDTKRFSGLLNTGNHSFNVTRTWNGDSLAYDGWNLVGNPYPSGLDASQLTFSGVENAAWFWDVNGSGNYKVWVPGGGETHSKYIPAMQGFFVHCNSSTQPSPLQNNGSVGFLNSARTHTLTEPFWKDAESISYLLRIKASGALNGYSDELTVYFNSDRNQHYEPGFDALKLSGNQDAPQIYTKIKDTLVTVNALSFSEKTCTVPLGFYINSSGSYRLLCSETESFPDNIMINLEDLKLNIVQDIRISPDYNFDYKTGDDPDRFRLHFYNPTFGLNGTQESGSVRIFSNNECIYIQPSMGNPVCGSVCVYDMIGKEIMNVQVNSDRMIMVRPLASKGTYIVRVISNTGVYTQKINL